MAKIAIFNQKGGVGKTTTSLNVTAALARRGYNPLSIDLDPQAHLSFVCGATVERPDESMFGFYHRSKPLTQLIRASIGGWLVIPAHVELSKVDTQFGNGIPVDAIKACASSCKLSSFTFLDESTLSIHKCKHAFKAASCART